MFLSPLLHSPSQIPIHIGDNLMALESSADLGCLLSQTRHLSDAPAPPWPACPHPLLIPRPGFLCSPASLVASLWASSFVHWLSHFFLQHPFPTCMLLCLLPTSTQHTHQCLLTPTQHGRSRREGCSYPSTWRPAQCWPYLSHHMPLWTG